MSPSGGNSGRAGAGTAGAGTDVAVESAGIVLVRSDPRDVVGAIQLSRASYRKMVENLVWATAYNLLAIPVAAGVLAPWGVELPMAVGAIATIIVYAVRNLGLGAAEIGIVFGIGNLGAIVGAFLADPFRRRVGLGPAMILSTLLEAPGILLIAIAPAAAPIPFLVASGVLMGQLESFGLWPFMAVIDRVHEDRRSGDWPPLARNGRVFAYEVAVHALFGAVLGSLLGRED